MKITAGCPFDRQEDPLTVPAESNKRNKNTSTRIRVQGGKGPSTVTTSPTPVLEQPLPWGVTSLTRSHPPTTKPQVRGVKNEDKPGASVLSTGPWGQGPGLRSWRLKHCVLILQRARHRRKCEPRASPPGHMTHLLTHSFSKCLAAHPAQAQCQRQV